LIEAFTVIIPSAGHGERFGSDIPKQYLKIGQKLVINYSLDLFLNFKECKRIIVAVSNINAIPEDLTKDSRIEIIEGGQTRGESVRKCFDKVSEDQSSMNVLIHDAARPCLTRSDVDKFLKLFCSSNFAGMIFANPSTDTLKLSIDGKNIEGSADRSVIWQAQTPQIFKYENLNNAYSRYSEDYENLTDESSLFDETDDQVFLYNCSSKNIKITHEEDLQLAEYLVQNIEE
tara:strand:+ start:401 stop:1093 length:693 start_codon:yes stop_codon:yes gene_type:complete